MAEENLRTFENEEYRHTYWHSCSHIMAQAVQRLWPEVKLAIGPAIAEGWYYDMLAPFAFTPEHMEQIGVDDFPLGGTDWYGYAVVDPQNGDTQYLGNTNAPDAEGEYAYLSLRDDGTGEFGFRNEVLSVDWSYLDKETVCLESSEAGNFYCSLYRMPDGFCWLLMQHYSDLIWFY